MRIKFSPTPKKDNFTMNMEKRVFKMVGLQDQASETFLTFSEGEAEKKADQEKAKLDLFRCQSHFKKFIMAA